MPKQIVYYQDQYYQDSEIPEALLDRGFFFGDGVFESMVAFNSKVLGLSYHIERLFYGLNVLKISHPWKMSDIQTHLKAMVDRLGESTAYIRLCVTRGRWIGTVPPFGEMPAHLHITARKYLPFREEIYEKGYRTRTLSIRRNNTSPLCHIKSLNYLDNVLGRMDALDNEFDEGIFLNCDGRLCEGTASNLFLIRNSCLITPWKEDGILEGVTRRLILEHAPMADLKTDVRSVKPEEILEAEEAFITNAHMGIIPWVQNDHQWIGSGRSGPKTKLLRQIYHQLVNTAAQTL